MTPDDCILRVEELEKRFQVHMDYQRIAMDKAALELKERLESMNEFRAQLKEQASTFIKRDDVIGRLDKLEQFVANVEGKIWAFMVLATVLGSGIGIFISHILR